MLKFFLRNIAPQRALSRISVLAMDILMIVFSGITVFLLHYGLQQFDFQIKVNFFITTCVLVFFNLFTFSGFRTFSGVIRYSVFTDLLRIVYALTLGYFLSLVLLLILDVHTHSFDAFGTVFFAIFLVNLLLMIVSRISIKVIYETISEKPDKPTNVLIYGTQYVGTNLAESIKANSSLNFRLRGFISDDEKMVGKNLLGHTVYAVDDNLFRDMKLMNVNTVIVAPHKVGIFDNHTLLEKLVDHNISLLTPTPMNEWNGELTTREQLKDVQIEDLLPRNPITINMKQIADHIEGKSVMITGAAGSIGSEIVRQVAAFNPFSIILIDQAETPLHDMSLELQKNWVNVKAELIVADISNGKRMDKIFAKYRPEYIFHAAAYKHVPMMEYNVSESVQNNILGTRILADLAVKHNVKKFVMVSTDKAVNPSNIMGCSKRICEIYVQSLAKHVQKNGPDNTQFITTRFGNVLGSNGSVIPLFREQIKNGGPITVTHPEIVRYFMTIPEACQLVLEAGSMGNGGEIYLFDMGKPVKILELAKRMIRLSGTPHIKIEFTGLRHGEKLYEELLNDAESTIKTYHDKITIAQVREYAFEEVKEKINNLIAASYTEDDYYIVKKMKEIVPEFQSKNSPYEAVDRLIKDTGPYNI